MVESQQQPAAPTETKVEDISMKEWKTCDESSKSCKSTLSDVSWKSNGHNDLGKAKKAENL